jgi:hypothetical protein
MRTCRFCRAEYCVVDNEGSSDTEVCETWTASSLLSVLPCLAKQLLTFAFALRSATGAIRAVEGLGSCFEKHLHAFGARIDSSL